jgi:hypothetical protein
MQHIDVDDELDGVRPESGRGIEIQRWCISDHSMGLGEQIVIPGLVGAAPSAIVTAGKRRKLAGITNKLQSSGL